MNMKRAWILIGLLVLFIPSHACIIREDDPGVSVGWYSVDGDSASVLNACRGWASAVNYTNRFHTPPTSFYYKQYQWCTGETEVRIDFWGREAWAAKVLMVWNPTLSYLTEEFLQQLTENMDELLKQGVNQGDPNCMPDCSIGEGINSLTGNAYYDSLLHMNEDLNLLMSYNSKSGDWNSSVSIALESTEANGDIPAIKTVVDEYGRKYPIYNYSDGWFCSGSGVMGYENPYTSQFEAEMKDRILKFNSDGKIDEIINRNTGRSIKYSYDDANQTIVVTEQSGLKKYTGKLNSSGKPESFKVEAGGGMRNLAFIWDEATGNLNSLIKGDLSVHFLYEDARFPSALTGVINEKGHRWLTYEYDDQKRVIRSYKTGEDGSITDEVTLDYRYTNNTKPFVRIVDEAGKVTDRYYNNYSGAERTEKVVEHRAGSLVTIWEYEFDYHGFVTKITDAKGVVTKIQSDILGREVSRVEAFGTPAQRETTTSIDEACGKASVITVVGEFKVTYQYDNACRLMSTNKTAI